MEKFNNAEDSKASEKDGQLDLPPTYEQSQESTASLHAGDNHARLTSWANGIWRRVNGPSAPTSQQATLDLHPPSKPLQILAPDPRRIICRCGRKTDTTKLCPGLANGLVRCKCGYIVSRDGSSRHEPAFLVCPGDFCGRQIDWSKRHLKGYLCQCGQRFSKQGIPIYEELKELDSKSLRCPCGAVHDITERCRVVHKDICQYEYWLPQGQVRCHCGRTLCEDGTITRGHPNSCCRRGLD